MSERKYVIKSTKTDCYWSVDQWVETLKEATHYDDVPKAARAIAYQAVAYQALSKVRIVPVKITKVRTEFVGWAVRWNDEVGWSKIGTLEYARQCRSSRFDAGYTGPWPIYIKRPLP